MGKLREFADDHPILKVWGPIGIIIIIAVAAVSAIFSSEIVRLWDSIVHSEKPIVAQAYEVGETVRFGQYDWRVLAVEDDKALLITKDVIEKRPYIDEEALYDWSKFAGVSDDDDHVLMGDVPMIGILTWEISTLRAYLNNEFYKSFSEEDQVRIALTPNINPDNTWGKVNGKTYNSPGGNPTNDYIFLLSFSDVLQYFPGLKRASAIEYNLMHKRSLEYVESLDLDEEGLKAYFNDIDEGLDANYEGKSSSWWLRSPGDPKFYCSVVTCDGFRINLDGRQGNDKYGVRPALWLKID